MQIHSYVASARSARPAGSELHFGPHLSRELPHGFTGKIVDW